MDLVGRHMPGEKPPEAPEGDLDLEAAGDEEGGVFKKKILIHREAAPAKGNITPFSNYDIKHSIW
jgi:hypothetical protein